MNTIILLIATWLIAIGGKSTSGSFAYATPEDNDPYCPLISNNEQQSKNNDKEIQRTLNVHLVPHTHDDVGWLKTVDQYFHGLNSTIQQAHVKQILDSVLSALSDPKHVKYNRTFTYVETKFFSMWYTQLSSIKKQILKHLIDKKRWTFVNGGWSMHDEANTHFMGMIDNTALGHAFLKKLNVVPTVGWQIDPFGHSATQGGLLTSGVGFDALYFGRIHYVDLEHRKRDTECEGLWRSSTTDDGSVFWGLTGEYGGNYGGPSGFCFDVKCDEWGESNSMVGLSDDVLLEKVKKFTQLLAVQASETKGRNIMLTMGMDFFYSQADQNFQNMDILLDATHRFLNDGSIKVTDVFDNRFDKVNIWYSNPERYTKCKHIDAMNAKERNGSTLDVLVTKNDAATWTDNVKTGDFFPYADCDHCYWSGYFSSRQGLKRMERVGSSFLHAARQIESMVKLQSLHTDEEKAVRSEVPGDDKPWTSSPLYSLEDAMGIAQHHDAVTGTSKQHVAYDYAKRIALGISDSSSFVTNGLRKLLFGPQTEILMNLSHCHLLNETICDISQVASKDNDKVIYVVVYNALAGKRTEAIPLPVDSLSIDSASQYKVEKLQSDMTWSDVSWGIVPNPNYAEVEAAAQFTLHFNASDIPPLGAAIFRISKSLAEESLDSNTAVVRQLKLHVEEDLVVKNGVLKVKFDSTTGVIKSISKQHEGGVSVDITQEYGFYTPFFHEDEGRSSQSPITHFNTVDNSLEDEDDGWLAGYSKPFQNGGAYVFRPSTPDQSLQLVPPKVNPSITIYESDLVTEVHAEFGDWIKQITRITDGKDYVEVEYVVGPVPINDGVGKEVVSRYSTTIANKGIFYTDANGREFMQRKRGDPNVFGYDAEFDPDVEPIAGNYYPVNTAIYIEEEKRSFTILTDRSQGGSSLSDGSIELMIQRRLLHDDARGVGEPLNETDIGITSCPPYGNATREGNGVIIKGTHRIMIGTNGASQARSEMDKVFSQSQVFVASASKDANIPFHQPGLSMLKSSLPDNVMVVTYAVFDDEKSSSFLVRLAHQYGANEIDALSSPANVNIKDLFPNHDILAVVEKTLSGNQDRADWEKRRLQWDDGTGDKYEKPALQIVLKPLEFRTFVIKVASPMAPSSSCQRGRVSTSAMFCTLALSMLYVIA